MRKYKVFISEVQKELKAERRAVKDFILGDPLCRRYFDVFIFEDIPATGRRPDKVYLNEVKNSSVGMGAEGAPPTGGMGHLGHLTRQLLA